METERKRSTKLRGKSSTAARAVRSRRIFCEVLEDRLALATITVTSLADNLDTDGQVTLREAIEAANTDQSVDSSVAGLGPDQIVFASSLTANGPQSIDLLPGQLELAGEVTLDGPGHDLLTIDAQEQSRIFAVLGGGVPEFDVAIEGLTLTRGKSTSVGSAIFFNSSRTLTLTNVVVSDSSTTGSNAGGDGIYVGVGSVDGNFVGGAVTLLNSTVSGNHTEGSSC